MKTGENRYVSLAYDLKAGGEIADRATAEKPLEFIYGLGMLLPSFEENIKGLGVGDKFDFKLKAADAYGDRVAEAVIDLPKSVFMVEGDIDNDMLTVGNHIPMMDNQGNQMIGTVVSVGDESVTMDFNHPMAGKDLHFTGEIVGVREATDVDKAKFMGLGGGCSCGCNDQDCDQDCNCGDDHGCDCGCGN